MNWKFELMLPGKGSSRPDWFNVLGDQALHIHFRFAVMDSKEIPADFEAMLTTKIRQRRESVQLSHRHSQCCF